MIVKNLLVVGVVAGFATAAASAEEGKANWKVGGTVRVDNAQDSTDLTLAGGKKTTSKSSSINLYRAQFSLTGEHGADSIYIKYYAEKNYLRTATITHKFSDMLSAKFGKMQLLAQSWETAASSTDQYMYSYASEFVANTDNPGVQLNLSFGDHNIALQAMQGLATVGEVEFPSSGGLTTAIQYSGNINNMIKPLVSYTMVRTASSRSYLAKDGTSANYGDGYQTHMGAGVMVAAGGANIDLELNTVKIHKQKGSTEKDQNVQSIVAEVKYPVGATTPFLKVTSDSHKKGAAQDVGDISGMGLALGVEHSLDSNCRLHAVYISTNSTEKAGTAGDNKGTRTGFNIGVTAAM